MYLSRLSQPIKGPPPVQKADLAANIGVQKDVGELDRALAAVAAKHSPSQPAAPGQPASASEIHKVRPLMVWKYSENTDTCAICRGKLIAPCVDCFKPLSEPCKVEWGSCSHGYHAHCIETWIEQRMTCPQCQRGWEAVSSDDPVRPEC